MGGADNGALRAIWGGGRGDDATDAVNTGCRDGAAGVITTG